VTRAHCAPCATLPLSPLQEWDGLVRVAFLRKNKTLAGTFRTAKILELVERNYRLHCSLNNLVSP